MRSCRRCRTPIPGFASSLSDRVGMIGDPVAAPAVVARLEEDPAPHVRLAAIDVIGRMTPAEALTVLEPLTRSANEDIARTATAALGNVDRDEALAILEQASRAPEPWKRLAAVDALARRREARVPQILQWLAAVDRAPEVVSAALDALARVGMRDDEQGSAAARALIALTAEPSRRESAITVLSGLPPRRMADVIAGLASCINRREVRERRGAGADETTRCVSRLGVARWTTVPARCD